MSDVLSPSVPPLPDNVLKLLTAEDLGVLPSQLPSGPVRYELHHGRLIAVAPPGDVHGAVVSNFATELKVQGERRGHGKARCGEGAIVLGRNPDHVFAADAVFITNKRLPSERSPEGYLATIPDLVVEVHDRKQPLALLRRKAEDYLRAGVVVVWVVDPIQRNVLEYRAVGAEPTAYAET